MPSKKMDFQFFLSIFLSLNIVFIEYSQAQRYEGSPCNLYNGGRGTCKKVDQCESIRTGILQGTLRYEQIVQCSFLGSVQIACCADEKPIPGRDRPTRPTPNSDFAFIDPMRFKTTSRPISATTASTPLSKPSNNNHNGTNNPVEFYSHLSGDLNKNASRTTTKTPFNNNFNATSTTTKADLLPWMQDVLNEYSTTPKSNINQTKISIPTTVSTTTSKPTKTTTLNTFWSEWSMTQPTVGDQKNKSQNYELINEHLPQTPDNRPTEPPTIQKEDLLPWMQDVLNELSTTSKSDVDKLIRSTTPNPAVVTEMPSWMQNILDEHSTQPNHIPPPRQTDKSSLIFGDGALVYGCDGSGKGDLHLPQNRSNENDSSKLNRPRPDRPDYGRPSSSGSKYIRGAKAEAACERYSQLPTTDTITFNILGGTPTNLGEFPWMAAIGYRDENDELSYDCGGTIISEEYILTAAHCAPSRRPPRMVRLGKVSLLTDDDEAEPLDIPIKDVIKNPNYSSATKKNDIALFRLERRIDFTEYIRPACLRTDMGDVPTDIELLVTGWGTISADRTQKSSVLLKTNVTSMPLYLCNRTLLNYNAVANQRSLRDGLSEGQCCAFDAKASHDACQGDSGGPLQFFPNKSTISSIIGIISFGISCGTELPSVYTRVAYYLDWIEPIVWPNL